jgi:hypothetical protein
MKRRAIFSYKEIELGQTYLGREVTAIGHPYPLYEKHTDRTITIHYKVGEGKVTSCMARSFADWVRKQIKKKRSTPPTTGAFTLGHN